MGLCNNGGHKIFLGIKDGKISHKEKDSEVINYYDNLEGTLRGMWIKPDGIYGPELHITLRDAGQDYCLQMKVNSGYARSFMKIAPNFDLAVPMKLVPSVRNKPNEKTDYGMFVYQNGKALKWYYSKETPNGMPDLVPCKIRDKTGQLVDGWDGSAQLDFLIKSIIEQNKLIAPDKLVQSRENVEQINEGTEQ